jgi:hypothetical protein
LLAFEHRAPALVPLHARAAVAGQEAGFVCLLGVGSLLAASLGVFGMSALGDLATLLSQSSDMMTTSVSARRRIPFLVVRAAGTDKTVRLDLRRGRRQLPPDQPQLLAAAISTGRQRSEPSDREAQEIATGLRRLADNPLASHL